jgi:hypothetical protein
MPGRYWGYKDVGINTFAGGTLLLAISKGLRPGAICQSVTRFSIRILAALIIINLFFLGLCLSNTPASVKRYTETFTILSWLQQEEPMIEYGYRHEDPDIGTIYSRYTLEELREIDLKNGSSYGRIVSKEIWSGKEYKDLLEIYSPITYPFIYEFLLHIIQRDKNFNELLDANDRNEMARKAYISFRENLLIELYFSSTLKHSGLFMTDKDIKDLLQISSSYEGDFTSVTGMIITAFSLKSAMIVIAAAMILVIIAVSAWERRLVDHEDRKST